MTARLERIEWLWLAGLALLTVVVGAIAGMNPPLAIGLATACAYTMLAFTNLALAVAIFAAEPLKYDVNESSMVALGVVLLLIAWLAIVVNRNEAGSDFLSVHPSISLVLGLFVGWALLSATWAEDPKKAFDAAAGYAAGAALIPIVFTAVRRQGQAVMVAAVFAAGSAAMVVLAFMVGTTREVDPQPGGSKFDPNELAAALVAGAALAVGAAQSAKRRPELRLLAYGAAALCVLGVFFSVSRGGLVALGAMMLAAIIFGGRWRGRIALLAAAVAISTVYYFAALAPDTARDRIVQSTEREASLREGRSSIWQVGWRMVEANPVQGVGAGNFTTSSRHYLLQPGTVWRSDQIIDTPMAAHNTYLGHWAEVGIVGLSLFLVVALFAISAALTAARNFARRRDEPAEILARSLAIGLVGLLTAAFFLTHPFNKGMWMLFGLSAALLAISKRRPQPTSPARTS